MQAGLGELRSTVVRFCGLLAILVTITASWAKGTTLLIFRDELPVSDESCDACHIVFSCVRVANVHDMHVMHVVPQLLTIIGQPKPCHVAKLVMMAGTTEDLWNSFPSVTLSEQARSE